MSVILGNDTFLGGGPGNFTADRKTVISVTLPDNLGGLVDQVRVWMIGGGAAGVTGQTQKIRGVVYADSAGSPGALLGSGDEVTATWDDLQHQQVFPFSTPVTVPGGSTAIHIGIICGTTTTTARYYFQTGASGSSRFNTDTYSDGPASTFGSPTLSTQNPQFSVRFATFAASVGTPPVISPNSARVNDVLTCTPGTYTGTPTPTVTRQWMRDGVAISGQTGTTYTLQLIDVAHAITIRETAVNTGGTVTSDSNVIFMSPATNWRNMTAIAGM